MEYDQRPSDSTGMQPGKAFLVGAGPGDPDLITVKGLRILEQADVVLYDRLVHSNLLDLAPSRARRIFVGKRCGKASMLQEEINRLLVEEVRAGHRVVRLKGGDPFIFGRGGEECLALVRHGIEFEVVPGISSVSAVPAYAGIPLTHRNLASGFTVVSGHLHGASAPHDWSVLAQCPTLVILMGLRNLDTIATRIVEAGRSEDTPVAVIHQGTTEAQQVVTGSLANVAERAAGLEPPAVIVIGEVAALRERLHWFDALPVPALPATSLD